MSEQKRALVTGLTGQDGSYLAEFLLGQGYEVFGLVRRTSSSRLDRIEGVLGQINVVYGDLLDQSSLQRVLGDCMPHEVYNLAAQSFVPTSFAEPVLTAEVTALGATRLLEAVRHVHPGARYYQASSSEMFGAVRETPQTEMTPFVPRSPMEYRNSMRTGPQCTTARPMASSHAAGSSLITSLRVGVRNL